MKRKNKIFCIGLNKTGTNSLHEAFKMLGFSSVHFSCEKGNIKDIIKNNHENGNELLLGIEVYDAYSDWNHPSTNHLYKEFDKQYPGSKFILNTRNPEDWLISRERHVLREPNLKKMQELYPNDSWYNVNKAVWRQEFEELHNDILEYFRNREEDLLVFNLFEGDSWKKLCAFLKVPEPNLAFPHMNKTPKNTIIRKINFFLRPVKKLFKQPF